MKRLQLIVLLLLHTAVAAHAFERTVLMESFSNVYCSPCHIANSVQDAIIQDLGRNVAVIARYHWYWEPGDPFYEYNIDENMARFRYYSVPYVPRLRLDGVSWVDPDSDPTIRNAINQRRAIAAPCTIEVSTTIHRGDTIEATVRVTAEEDMHNYYTRLFVSLIHRCYQWDDDYWWYPFRDMEPGTLGVSFQLDADSTFEFVADFTTDSGWNPNDMTVIAFVQIYNTKEVLQAGFADVADLAPTLYINEFMADNASTVQDPQGEYEDWVEIYNPGPDAVNLDRLSLTDNLAEPYKWNFPDTSLFANECIIVWCETISLIQDYMRISPCHRMAGKSAFLWIRVPVVRQRTVFTSECSRPTSLMEGYVMAGRYGII
jgi:hypothetical protein